jgi:hypothetical protein
MLLHFPECFSNPLPKNRAPMIAAKIGMSSVSMQVVPESGFGGSRYRISPDSHHAQGLVIFPEFAFLEEEIHSPFRPPALSRALVQTAVASDLPPQRSSKIP